jgi:hypothetical protein
LLLTEGAKRRRGVGLDWANDTDQQLRSVFASPELADGITTQAFRGDSAPQSDRAHGMAGAPA